MQPTEFDYLVMARTAARKIDKRVKSIEDEQKAIFIDSYKENGTDRKRSLLFGKEAGCLYIREGKPSERVTKFQLVDAQEATDWMDETKPETDSFAQDNLELFCKWWFERTGECPDGCTVITYDTEPGEPTAVLRVNDDVVLQALMENRELFGEVNQRLLGDGE